MCGKNKVFILPTSFSESERFVPKTNSWIFHFPQEMIRLKILINLFANQVCCADLQFGIILLLNVPDLVNFLKCMSGFKAGSGICLQTDFKTDEQLVESASCFSSAITLRAAVLFPLQMSQSYFVPKKKNVTSCRIFILHLKHATEGWKSRVVSGTCASVVKVDVEDVCSENDPCWGEVSELQYQTVNKKCALRGRRLRWNEGRQEPQRKKQ